MQLRLQLFTLIAAEGLWRNMLLARLVLVLLSETIIFFLPAAR